jgi:hypothetical protein
MTHNIRIEQARWVAHALLGSVPDQIEIYEPQVGGDDSYSYRLWLDGRPMLLKIKKRTGTPVSIYLHKRLYQAGIPVPGLIAFASQAGPTGEACAIWSWVEGKAAHWRAGQPCPF